MDLDFAPSCVIGAVDMKYPMFWYPIPAYKDLIGFSASRKQSNQMCVCVCVHDRGNPFPVFAKKGDQIEDLCRGDVT